MCVVRVQNPLRNGGDSAVEEVYFNMLTFSVFKDPIDRSIRSVNFK